MGGRGEDLRNFTHTDIFHLVQFSYETVLAEMKELVLGTHTKFSFGTERFPYQGTMKLHKKTLYYILYK